MENQKRHTRLCGVFVAMLVIVAAGCQTQLKKEMDTLKDLRPFVARSPAAGQNRLDGSTPIAELTASLSDRDPGVVMRAVSLLGESGDERAVKPLMTMIRHDDPRIRFVVNEAIVHLGGAAVPALIEALEHPEPETVVSAAEALGAIGDRRSVEPLCRVLGQHALTPARRAAATALGGIGGDRGIEALVRALDDDTEVQLAAAESLSRLGDAAIEPLMGRLIGSNEEATLLAIDILGKSGNPDVVDPLAALLDRDLSDAVRMATVTALGNTENPHAIPPLRHMMTHHMSVVRNLAAEALIRIGEPAAEPLAAMLSSTDPEVQDLAANALVKLGAVAVDPLLDRIRGTDSQTVWLVIDALSRIGDERAVVPIINKLDDPDADIAMKAADALGTIGDKRAIGPLVGQLTREDSPAVFSSADSLVKMGRAAAPFLVEALTVSEPGKRARLSDVLATIGAPAADAMAAALPAATPDVREILTRLLVGIGPDAADPLGAILAEADPPVRTATADALVRIGGPPAVNTLVAALTVWPARRIAADALEHLNWKPSTAEERIGYWVASGQKKRLTDQLDMTRYILLRQLRSGNTRQAAYGVRAMIAIGDPLLVPDLVAALDGGTYDQAMLYADSGQPELVAAAEGWLANNPWAKPQDTDPGAPSAQTGGGETGDRVMWGELGRTQP